MLGDVLSQVSGPTLESAPTFVKVQRPVVDACSTCSGSPVTVNTDRNCALAVIFEQLDSRSSDCCVVQEINSRFVVWDQHGLSSHSPF